jgi:hypothetical protein
VTPVLIHHFSLHLPFSAQHPNKLNNESKEMRTRIKQQKKTEHPSQNNLLESPGGKILYSHQEHLFVYPIMDTYLKSTTFSITMIQEKGYNS